MNYGLGNEENTMSEVEPEISVKVRRQYDDWRTATYRINDISGLHWSDVSGGVGARANRPYLHGYVWCNEKLDGELAHSCLHGEGPHRIKVCIVKKDNAKGVYLALKTRIEWEYRLRKCPFMVESAARITPTPVNVLAEIDSWLSSHCQPDGYVMTQMSAQKHWRSVSNASAGVLQVWFADNRTAEDFAAAFGMSFRGHQNQEKQHEMASQLVVENR